MARFAHLARSLSGPGTAGASRAGENRIGRSTAVVNDPPAAPARDVPADEAAYRELHAEREGLERDLALAKARQSFSKDADEVVRARADEAAMLTSLDRLLTRIRAAEYRRRPGARRW